MYVKLCNKFNYVSAPENIFYFKLQVTSKLKYNQKPNSIKTRSGQSDHIFV